MVNIEIICIGRLKERYWSDAAAEYSKRLRRYCNLKITELKEVRLPDNASAADEDNVKTGEGNRILRGLSDDIYTVALDINGKAQSSEQFAKMIEELSTYGKGNIVFIIGGSLGLSTDVIKRADCRLSFSPMTFPHQMMRVILLEQVYRSFKIIKHEAYHK